MEITWENYVWPEWVPIKIRDQVMEFWGCFNRNYKDWINNFPEKYKLGDIVTLCELCGDEKRTGRFVHCWNNIARLVHEDGTFSYVYFT